MNAKRRNGQPGECGERGISERNGARRFSRLSWKSRYLSLAIIAVMWATGVRSAQATCTPWWTSFGVYMYKTDASATWFKNNCVIFLISQSKWVAASSIAWTANQNTYVQSDWACSAEGFVDPIAPLAKGIQIAYYQSLTCQWWGALSPTPTPTNDLTVTGTGSMLGAAGVSYSYHSGTLMLESIVGGTFVSTPGSPLTFTSTGVGIPIMITDGLQPPTTSWAWTRTIPTSPATSNVTSNIFPTTSSSGSFIPTYAGRVGVVSTNSSANDASINLSQKYSIATKAFFANNSAAIGSLYSDGVVNYGTLLSSPTTGGGVGAAVDATGNVWSLASNENSVTLFNDTGAMSTSYSGANLSGAKALAIDGNNRTWFSNANSLTAMTNAGVSVFTNAVGAGNVSTPTAMSVDNAGSLWVANSGSNTVTEFVGVAGPVTVPVVAQVANVATGTLP